MRELKNIIERALLESGGDLIEPWHLHFLAARNPAANPPSGVEATVEVPLDLDEAVRQAEVAVVRRALAQCAGNVSEAARLLGASRNRIYRVLGEEDPAPGAEPPER